jgi:DNA-binding XRE family transcriptional regulator
MADPKITKLRRHRIKHGVPAAKLAKAADVSSRTLHDLETSRRRCRDTTRSGVVKALAKLSGEPYQAEDFFDDEGSPLFE